MTSEAVEQRVRASAAEGDVEGAMRALMKAYGGSVLAYCRRFARDEQDARDLRQSTFVEAFRSLSRFEGRSSYKTWLLSIARHRSLDERKGATRRRARHDAYASHPKAEHGAGDDERLALREILRRCLEELAPQSGEAVWLRHVAGLSYQELSEELGASVPALQMRVARSMRSLRGCVQQHGGAL